MRAYPLNSAEAAGRILALTIISDGNFALEELESLCRSRVFESLGLDEAQFRQIVQDLCDDLNATARHGIARLEPGLLDALLGEITDSGLRRTLLHAMCRIADADGWFSDGEAGLLGRASVTWQAENHFR